MARIPPQLQQAAEQIHQSNKPKMVRVKDLLSWFEAQRRGVLVVREIRSALRKAKLVTVPDFEVAYIDQRIKLKVAEPVNKKAAVSKEVVVQTPTGNDSTYEAVVGGSVPDPAPRIGMLKAANTPPITVTRDTEVSEAITLMLMNDYSQLPVMQGDRIVDGLISWRSIGRARIGEGKVCKHERECMEKAEIVTSDTHLFDAINIIAEKEVCRLIPNSSKSILPLRPPTVRKVCKSSLRKGLVIGTMSVT